MLRPAQLVVLASLAVMSACGARATPSGDALVSTDASSIDTIDVAIDRVEPQDVQPSIDVPEPDGACPPLNESSIRAPSVVMSGERAPLAAVAPSAGCGCRPTVVTRAPSNYALRACDCSNSDPCVDPPYVVNWDDDATTTVTQPTAEAIRIGGLTANMTRLPRDYRCEHTTDISFQLMMIETDNDAARSGPRRVWAFVPGGSSRCSGDPWPLVRISRLGESNAFSLSAVDCNNTDCDGPTSSRSYGVWVMVGELMPGQYQIFWQPQMLLRFFEVR